MDPRLEDQKRQRQIDEAIDALRAAAWEENVEPVYEHAVAPNDHLIYLHVCGTAGYFHPRSAPWGTCDEHPNECNVDDASAWRPVYVNTAPAPRKLVHCYLGPFGADWDVERVIELVGRADRVAWVDGPIGHDLGVYADGSAHYFEAKRPGGE